jgi:hypothetical protein
MVNISGVPSRAARWLCCDDARVPRFVLIIEGPNWKDADEIELGRPPNEGDPISTKYGTCLVTSVEATPGDQQFAGKVVCRLPS